MPATCACFFIYINETETRLSCSSSASCASCAAVKAVEKFCFLYARHRSAHALSISHGDLLRAHGFAAFSSWHAGNGRLSLPLMPRNCRRGQVCFARFGLYLFLRMLRSYNRLCSRLLPARYHKCPMAFPCHRPTVILIIVKAARKAVTSRRAGRWRPPRIFDGTSMAC